MGGLEGGRIDGLYLVLSWQIDLRNLHLHPPWVMTVAGKLEKPL